MRHLVTGSSGQIGSYVVDVARRRGHETRGLDREPDGGDRTDVVGDIRDEEVCRRALEGCEAVIHCAAQISVEASIEDPIADATTNVLGTLNLLEGASESNLEGRFLNVSSAAVYGDPDTLPIPEDHTRQPLAPYGQSKRAAEDYVKLYRQLHDLDAVTVRPFNVYSPRQEGDNPYSGVISIFAKRILAGDPPLVDGDGEQTRDFVHAADVARWMVRLAEPKSLANRDWQTFNLGTGQETSIKELARTMIEAAGMEDELSPEHRQPRTTDIRRSVADRFRLNELGLEDRVPLKKGLEELLETHS